MTQIIAGILLLGGATLILAWWNSRQRAKGARAWPTTQGMILKSDLITHVIWINGIRTTTYKPVVEYRYTVMGRPFTGTRVAFGSYSYDIKKGEGFVEKFAVGTQVTVYYNPEKLEESVLEPAYAGSAAFLTAGILFILFGLFLLAVPDLFPGL